MNEEPPQSYLGYYPESELVLGIVCPLGTNYRAVIESLVNYLGQFGYTTNAIRLSDEFPDLLAQLKLPVPDSGHGVAAEMRNKILAGNEIRKLTQNDVLALVPAGRIASLRTEIEAGESEPKALTAHVIATNVIPPARGVCICGP